MITTYSLENFKSYASVEMTLTGLNILAGLNSSGKSSLVQPLLIARQSFVLGSLEKSRLTINGPLANIGTGQDLMFEFAEREETRFAWDDCAMVIGYQPEETELSVEVSSTVFDGPPFQNMSYVSSARLGPQVLYEQHQSYAEQASLIVGGSGEYAPGYVAANGNTTPNPAGSKRAVSVEGTLLEQINHWMQRISPTVALELVELRDVDGVATRYTFDGKAGAPTRAYRSANVGFGLSHSVSVVTALLASPSGSLVVIEGPEANLHPRAQVRLGQLIGQAVGDGVQVIVETHSPAVVRGIGQAITTGWISRGAVTMHYCIRDDAESKVAHVQMNDRGGLDEIKGYDDVPHEWMEEFFRPGMLGG